MISPLHIFVFFLLHRSSLFLKKTFGLGYTLNINAFRWANEKAISAAITKVLPCTESIDIDDNSNLSYMISFESAPKFGKLFKMIEKKSLKFGIRNYGISVPTLQQVFLQLSLWSELPDTDEVEEKKMSEKGTENNNYYYYYPY